MLSAQRTVLGPAPSAMRHPSALATVELQTNYSFTRALPSALNNFHWHLVSSSSSPSSPAPTSLYHIESSSCASFVAYTELFGASYVITAPVTVLHTLHLLSFSIELAWPIGPFVFTHAACHLSSASCLLGVVLSQPIPSISAKT